MAAVVWGHPAPSTPYMSEAVRDEWGWASWRLSEPWSKSDSLEWLIPSDKVLQPSELPPLNGTVHARGWGSDMDSADVQVVWHRAPVWGQRQGRTDTMAVPRPRLMDKIRCGCWPNPKGGSCLTSGRSSSFRPRWTAWTNPNDGLGGQRSSGGRLGPHMV